MPKAADRTQRDHHAWYREPVVWLGIVIFIASLAGCVWMIVLGTQHGDTPLQTAPTVFGVPVSSHSSGPPPSSGLMP